MRALQQTVVFEITNVTCVPEGESASQLVRAKANRWVRENQHRIQILKWEPTDPGGLLGFKMTVVYEVLNEEDPSPIPC